MFEYANTRKNAALKIGFIYLGKKETYRLFKTCCIIYVLFSTKFHFFHSFIFLCPNNMFFINKALKLKYQPGHLKVNLLKTKRNLLYIRNQPIPRSKHLPLRL